MPSPDQLAEPTEQSKNLIAEFAKSCPPLPESLRFSEVARIKSAIDASKEQESKRLSDNPVAETKQARKDLDDVLQKIKASSRKSDERDNACHYLTNAIMWLGMDLKAQAEANPYPESYNAKSPVIEPTADGLKL